MTTTNKLYPNQIFWTRLSDGNYCGWTSNTKLIKYLYVLEGIGASRSALNPEQKRYGTEYIVTPEEKDRIEDILDQFNAWETGFDDVEVEPTIAAYLELHDFQKFYSYCFQHGLDWVSELRFRAESEED